MCSQWISNGTSKTSILKVSASVTSFELNSTSVNTLQHISEVVLDSACNKVFIITIAANSFYTKISSDFKNSKMHFRPI